MVRINKLYASVMLYFELILGSLFLFLGSQSSKFSFIGIGILIAYFIQLLVLMSGKDSKKTRRVVKRN